MANNEPGKRDAPISYRPPAHLRAEFHERVAKSGLSTNAFITAAVFGQTAPRARRSPPVERQELALLLARAGQIGDAMHEIARIGPAGGATPVIEAACRDLGEIRAAVLKLLERVP